MNAPNILLIVSDQERQRDWLPSGLVLPARQRLLDQGLEFTRYYTHTSPCSPSRGTLFTGQYLPVHGVNENCIMPANGELSTDAQTLGKLFRNKGYYTGYKGKWHLAPVAFPDMDAYGFSDWEGNDKAFWGQAGSGVEFDEPIARSAAQWIRDRQGSTQPWFLSVGLVNPHDVMWFPMDQPWYQAKHRETVEQLKLRYRDNDWGRQDPLPAFDLPYEQWFTELPANFDDDLHSKPDVHRRFMHEMSRSQGWIERDDHESWLRQLDYYLKLHQMSDESLGIILDALDATSAWNDTIVIFTADHGDQCGSHGLRSKGPWNYEETMRIPLYVVAPGITKPKTTTTAMMSAIDLAATICELGGVTSDEAQLPGRSMLEIWKEPSTEGRDYVLFAQDWAWYDGLVDTRYASRGIFDGRYKYCRYYGIGGSSTTRGTPIARSKMFNSDSPFEDQEHEFYDLQEDPGELHNLAHDRGRRHEVQQWFERLKEAEKADFAPLPSPT
jgi:arylsulfatase A-like enzyme